MLKLKVGKTFASNSISSLPLKVSFVGLRPKQSIGTISEQNSSKPAIVQYLKALFQHFYVIMAQSNPILYHTEVNGYISFLAGCSILMHHRVYFYLVDYKRVE